VAIHDCDRPLVAKMNSPTRPLSPIAFLRRQQSYVAVAVAIYLAMWAVDRPVPIGATLFYTLSLCNLIVLVQDHLAFLYTRKSLLLSWVLFLAVLLVASISGVMVVNLIESPAHRGPGQTLWQYLGSGWKMPFMATMIFGVSSHIYRRTRERLETRNRDLQCTLAQEAAARELQGQELQQAREIQRSLLPKQIPQVEGFEIDGAWEPARVVGGDYFDIIRLGEKKLGICIADVVGKSVSAALLMANVQASVRAFAGQTNSPAVLCSRVNSVLCSTLTSGKFVTLFYGTLDAERATLLYTNAGHLAPVLLSEDGRVTRLENNGALLGVLPAWKYQESLVQLSPGDRLLLFTDGITEASASDGEEFGEDRLISCALACSRKSVGELKLRLLEEVKQFCASQLSDDATLIIISALARDAISSDSSKPTIFVGAESV
jgi:phosphoserine phosphatase RsbU/P